MLKNRGREIKAFVVIILSALTLFAYQGVRENGFIVFDDPMIVTENLRVIRGMNEDSLAWAFTTTHTGNWHPLTWISLMLDGEWFGMNPAGYHWTNLILHLLGGVILFLALNRMTAAPVRSGLVAALFLIHPLHVESVAWVSERKDVLNGLFWALGLWCYGRYAEQPLISRYVWVVVVFACGLASKPMSVTFPFVLLLLDQWPLAREPVGDKGKWGRLVVEKIPLFVLSASASVLTFQVQKHYQAVSSLSAIPFGDRVANAAASYMVYITKTVWPAGLSLFYPYHGPPQVGFFMMSTVLLAAITVLTFLQRRCRPYLIVGWLWYLGTLVPVIGIVKVGSQAMADRYTYIPLIGLFIMAVWGIKDLLDGYRWKNRVWIVSSGVVIAVFVFLTQIQVGYWKDSNSLLSHTLRHTERNFIVHELLGHDMAKAGNYKVAEQHFREAIRIKPTFKNALNGLGYIMMIQGQQEEAGRLFEKVLQVDPAFAPALKNLGDVRMRQGRVDGALLLYRQALPMYKENRDPEFHNNYGVSLFLKGEREEAILQFREAVSLKPDYAEAQENLRKVLAEPK